MSDENLVFIGIEETDDDVQNKANAAALTRLLGKIINDNVKPIIQHGTHGYTMRWGHGMTYTMTDNRAWFDLDILSK